MSETITAFADAEVTETDVLYREMNTGLMVAWINADLLNRCGHDVRSSIVLYDEDGDFTYAVAPGEVSNGPRPDEIAQLWPRLWAAGVRSWSRGIV